MSRLSERLIRRAYDDWLCGPLNVFRQSVGRCGIGRRVHLLWLSVPRLNSRYRWKYSRHLPTHYFSQAARRPFTICTSSFLAELGDVGFALFVWVCIRTRKSVARIVKSIPAESPYRVWAQFYSLGLIYLLIWWNNSALFGGQIETILAFTFLAALASVARLERQRVEQLPAINRKI